MYCIIISLKYYQCTNTHTTWYAVTIEVQFILSSKQHQSEVRRLFKQSTWFSSSNPTWNPYIHWAIKKANQAILNLKKICATLCLIPSPCQYILTLLAQKSAWPFFFTQYLRTLWRYTNAVIIIIEILLSSSHCLWIFTGIQDPPKHRAVWKRQSCGKHASHHRRKKSYVTPGLGFCHGKNYFCRTVEKTGKNRQKLRFSYFILLISYYVSVSYLLAVASYLALFRSILDLNFIVPIPFAFHCIKFVSLHCEPSESITVHAEHSARHHQLY